jgi:Rod binding domain-containing protein
MESAACAAVVGTGLRPTAATETWGNAAASLAKLQYAFNKAGCASRDDEALRAHAARQLASLFVYQLLREMRKTIPRSALFDGGRAQEIYEQMIDERLADRIAASNQLGLADMIHTHLLKYD